MLAWKVCDDCNIRTRNTRRKADKFYCWNCYLKQVHIIGGSWTLTKSLDKTYEIKGKKKIVRGKGYLEGFCHFPPILIGHKFKVMLCKEKSCKRK